ncbi:MAG: PP2C family serine/threonine-protein phosphatase [Candidatus Melainabacteria bacterium]|nr:PP2C family serine/threonine-protein phosphatase [Candidatus Melainabacteria bacterium]
MGTTSGAFLAKSVMPFFAASNQDHSVMTMLLSVAALILVAAVAFILTQRSHVTKSGQSAQVKVQLSVTVGGGTHIGGRANNEDRYLIKVVPPASDPRRVGMVVIADGMGGMAAGETAATTVIEAFDEVDPTVSAWFSDGILGGNNKMAALFAADYSLKGFGTTTVAARFCEDEIELGSCGDSHFFRLRGGQLERLTEEHSLGAMLVRNGQLSASQLSSSPLRNTLYRCVGGTAAAPEWDSLKFPMQSADVYLVCSDGLVDYSSLTSVQQILSSGKSAQEIAHDLLAMAVADNTRDNATAVVMLVS